MKKSTMVATAVLLSGIMTKIGCDMITSIANPTIPVAHWIQLVVLLACTTAAKMSAKAALRD